MDTLTKTVIDGITGEVEIIELTPAEIKERETESKLANDKIAEMEIVNQKKAADRAALLIKLGISTEEAALLLS
jgi:hypothetical protein